MKKIAYISSIAFSDVDISFLQTAQKTIDITYVIVVGKGGEQSCALNFCPNELHPGMNSAKLLPAMQRFSTIIDLSRVFVFYKTSYHAYQIRSFLQERILFNYLKKEKFDVIHITSFPSFLNPFMYLLRKKIVLTVHDPIPHYDITYKMDKFNRRIACKYIRRFILLNEAQRDTFIEYYKLNTRKVHVYSSFLSSYTYLTMYEPKEIDYARSPYILFFGNITPYKGVEYLMQAMIMVNNKKPELNLIVAGSGNYYFDTTPYSSQSFISIQNRFIPDEELSNLIRNCEFVVVPYVEATQSGVVMSSYAFDKPCIATNEGGLPEMVLNGTYGTIVESKNSVEIAKAIEDLYSEKKRMATYSNNIHNDYHNGVKSWKQVAQELTDIYNTL